MEFITIREDFILQRSLFDEKTIWLHIKSNLDADACRELAKLLIQCAEILEKK